LDPIHQVFITSIFLGAVYLGSPLLTPQPPPEFYTGCSERTASLSKQCVTGSGDDIKARGIMVSAERRL
jgi:hypothetical protein